MVETQNPMRVGYILKVFPRLSETFVLNEILELQRQGVEVDIFALKSPVEPRFHAGLAQLKSDVTYLPHPRPSVIWPFIQSEFETGGLDAGAIGRAFQYCLRSKDPSELKYLLQAFALAGQVQKRGIGHLHAHFATSATKVTLLAHLLSGLRFSFTAHAKDIYHREADHSLIREALRRCHFAVTVTNYNLATLSQIEPDAVGRVHRIYNGTHLPPLEPTVGSPPGPPLIVGVGRLIEKKGFSYLLQACRLLVDRGVEFRCRIIGTGEAQSRLQDQIQSLHLRDVVTLVGARSHQEVLRELGRCRLAVLPCVVGKDGNRDALPTVLLEAMALGKPVVSTDLEGVDEIVEDGETGLIASQRDSVSLADALSTLLVNGDLARSMGQSGREKAERVFDLRHNVGLLRDLLCSEASASSQPPRIAIEGCV